MHIFKYPNVVVWQTYDQQIDDNCEFYEWIAENINHPYLCLSGTHIVVADTSMVDQVKNTDTHVIGEAVILAFEDVNDAMMFKLRWV